MINVCVSQAILQEHVDIYFLVFYLFFFPLPIWQKKALIATVLIAESSAFVSQFPTLSREPLLNPC